MQVSTSLQTDNHASTPPLSFLQAGCPSCRPTNSVKALKAAAEEVISQKFLQLEGKMEEEWKVGYKVTWRRTASTEKRKNISVVQNNDNNFDF